jgi:hypothetical protein
MSPKRHRRGRPATFLALLIVAPALMAQSVVNLTGRWRINGNHFPGDLVLQQAPDGTLSGTIYGNPLTGYHASAARSAVMLRGPASRPDQVYVATISADARSMSGVFYALNAANGGASMARNVFPFRVQRGTTSTPSSPGSLPSFTAGGPASIDGTYEIDGNGFRGPLVIAQSADGALTGTRVYTDPIYGHYAQGTGTMVFVRERGGRPFQVFTGTAYGSNPPILNGNFLPLNAGGGASAERLLFRWGMEAAPAPTPRSMIVVANLGAPDVVRQRRDIDCDDMLIRVFYGETGTHVDVARGQRRALLIAGGRRSEAHSIRWSCRGPGNTSGEEERTTCPGNSNVVEINRIDDDGTLVCAFRPGLP